MPKPRNDEYHRLAQSVRKRTNAQGVIVIIIKDNDSQIAQDLPPAWFPYLPDILQNCAQQSAAFLRGLAEELQPRVNALLKRKREH